MSYESLRPLYDNFASAVAYIALNKPDGCQATGSAFHIGDGVFIAARHVIEGNTITEFATTEWTYKETDQEFNGIKAHMVAYGPGKGKVVKGPFFHPDPTVDIAALIVEGIECPSIPLGGHLDDWLDTGLVLYEVVIFGYPPIPFCLQPILVAARAEVNAIVDTYKGQHPQFIISAMARGGFSGGPAIMKGGCVLGVITESLNKNEDPPELGYLSVLTIEPIYTLLEHYRITPTQVVKEWEEDYELANSIFSQQKKSTQAGADTASQDN